MMSIKIRLRVSRFGFGIYYFVSSVGDMGI